MTPNPTQPTYASEREAIEAAAKVAIRRIIPNGGGQAQEIRAAIISGEVERHLSRVQQPDAGKWVACSQRMPSEYGEYLAASKARPRGWVTMFAPVGWICRDDYPVTHWTELPPTAPTAASGEG